MSVEEDVRAFNDSYERALAEQDAETLIGLYHDDARILMPGQPAIEGREAIAKLFRDWIEGGPVTIRFETEQILASGDLVVDVGRTFQDGRRSKYVVVHRREPDGRLRIAIDAPSGNG